ATATTHDRLNRLMSARSEGPVVFKGLVNEPATVKVQAAPVTVRSDNSFEGTPTLTAGTNTVTISATDPAGNTSTASYEVDQAGPAWVFTYDLNGNLTWDGSKTYEWDAKNRLVAVNMSTHRSEFTYDGIDRRVRIVEK